MSTATLLRHLRVLIACVVLAFAAAPSARADVDAVACVATSVAAAATTRPGAPRSSDALAGACEAAAATPSSEDRAAPRHAHSFPGGARSVVAIRRIYLRHASLLR